MGGAAPAAQHTRLSKSLWKLGTFFPSWSLAAKLRDIRAGSRRIALCVIKCCLNKGRSPHAVSGAFFRALIGPFIALSALICLVLGTSLGPVISELPVTACAFRCLPKGVTSSAVLGDAFPSDPLQKGRHLPQAFQFHFITLIP